MITTRTQGEKQPAIKSELSFVATIGFFLFCRKFSLLVSMRLLSVAPGDLRTLSLATCARIPCPRDTRSEEWEYFRCSLQKRAKHETHRGNADFNGVFFLLLFERRGANSFKKRRWHLIYHCFAFALDTGETVIIWRRMTAGQKPAPPPVRWVLTAEWEREREEFYEWTRVEITHSVGTRCNFMPNGGKRGVKSPSRPQFNFPWAFWPQ